jgi:hypothetical protein
MKVRWLSVMVLGAVLASLCGPAFSAPPVLGSRRIQPETPGHPQQVDLSQASVRARLFAEAMAESKVPEAKRPAYADDFARLPESLQADLAVRLSDKQASLARVEPFSRWIDELRIRGPIRRMFAISSVWPQDGSPDCWSYVMGWGLNANCRAALDGALTESYYLAYSEFFGNCVAFKTPASTPRGSMHNLTIRDTATSASTADWPYKIVAPRGYRGYWGWQFANFGWSTIPWEMFRDYFGAAATEDASHNPLPGPWDYYQSTYRSAGNGGNCFGMSVSSLRIRNNQLNTYWKDWFADPAHHQTCVWGYPWQTETRQTVQECQGAWFTREILTTHSDLWNHQDHRTGFNRAASLVAEPTNRPILVFWGSGWGHAVVPYSTAIAGDDHKIIVYDNNAPYSESENGPQDPSVAHVYWGANSFSYGGGTKAEMFSYEECTPNPPHLPTHDQGGPGADTLVATIADGGRAAQITDEAGRRFFNPDGSVNENPATKIPNSAPVYPMTQRPLVRALTTGGTGSATPVGVPPNAPHIFVFGSAGGKTLTFDLAGQGSKQIRFFLRGFVFGVDATGTGQLRLNSVLQGNRLEVPNPAALQPTGANVIRTLLGGDRVFELRNLRNLGTGALQLTPAADGSSLDVRADPGLQFDMNVRGLVGGTLQQVAFAGLALQTGGRALLQPQNWANLQTSSLTLQHRNAANQLLQTIQVPHL